MTASSATSSSSWTTTSDASAKFLAVAGAADRRPARAAAVCRLRHERLADAVGRAMAQAGCGDLSRSRSAPCSRSRGCRCCSNGVAATTDTMPATFSLPAGADLRRLLLLLAAFAIYFLAMPVIGNMIASALFLFASMWLLSDDPDPIAAAARDLRHRHCAVLRVVLRPASESADARRACSGNGCFDTLVIPGRREASNPESRTSQVRNCAPSVRASRAPE